MFMISRSAAVKLPDQYREDFMRPWLRGLSTEWQCEWRANKAVSFNCI
jgi:hypothetical protein